MAIGSRAASHAPGGPSAGDRDPPRGSQTQVFRPSEGPSQNLPPGVKKVIFFAPCGAKLWGSGGAPPTNLILLRNQRLGTPARRHHAHAVRTTPGGHRTPNPRPTRPHPGPSHRVGWLGGWRLAVGVGGGPRPRVETQVGAVASDKYGPQDGDAHLRLRRLRLQRDQDRFSQRRCRAP